MTDKTTVARSVEDWVNSVNYSDYSSYIPTEFAIHFVNFIKLVNGAQGEENLTPVVHYKMLDTLTQGNNRIANMCHRGIAKTTLMGEYLFLYLAVFGQLPNFGKVNLALYVSDSIENGVKNMRKNLEYRYENSDFLREWIPKVKLTDVRWEFTNKSGQTLIVKGYGAQTGVRGAKEMGVRPQLAVLDDLLSDEDAKSPTVIENVEATIYKAVTYALLPKRNMIVWSGTPFNSKDPLYKAVESGAWAVNVFPVCEQFPCEPSEFAGSWPDRFTYAYVKEQYDIGVKTGKIADFNQELMLRIMSEEDRMIRDHDIRWYKRHQLLKNRSNFNFYITTDFATSEKQSADYSVISVWALDHAGNWYWVDGICRRQLMDQNIDDLFRLVQRYKPQSVGVEVTGQQGGFIRWIQTEMMDRNIIFNLASENNEGRPGIRPNTNKIQRFNAVVPWFKMGRMYFPEDMRTHECVRELVEELSLVTRAGFKSKHDDAIDTVSMLSLIPVWRPSAQMPAPTRSGEREDIWELDDDNDQASALDSYIV